MLKTPTLCTSEVTRGRRCGEQLLLLPYTYIDEYGEEVKDAALVCPKCDLPRRFPHWRSGRRRGL
jgi:hypothetical protein